VFILNTYTTSRNMQKYHLNKEGRANVMTEKAF